MKDPKYQYGKWMIRRYLALSAYDLIDLHPRNTDDIFTYAAWLIVFRVQSILTYAGGMGYVKCCDTSRYFQRRGVLRDSAWLNILYQLYEPTVAYLMVTGRNRWIPEYLPAMYRVLDSMFAALDTEK